MMAGRAHFPGVSHVGEPFLGHQNLTPAQHYEMGMVGEMLLPPPPQTQQRNVEFRSDSSSVSGFEDGGGGVGGNGRWPRQETLTLLEIRSRLDHKFKEANHKGPLWDEVSRIMGEEHGYQRSGKKCREKLENLYKYYKKTKEGKAGRQDGKHYRFFRQLEALYGENSNPALETNVVDKNQCQQISNPSTSQANQEPLHAQKFCESLSLSNSSEFNTCSSSSSSDDEDLSGIAIKEGDVINTKKDTNGLKRGRKSWKSKVREFIDLQMKKFMDIQETWLEKMLKTLEHQEKERIAREEAWRKQESERFDREHRFWESERAWIEARDAALVEALKKFSDREFKAPEDLHTTIDTDRDGENECETFQSTINNRRWLESEILCLIKLRSAMESSFQEFGGSKLAMWEELSAKMGGMGYERSAKRCKEKWEYINKYLKKTEDCNKKRKENSITCPYFHHLDSLYSQRGGICGQEPNDQTHETMGHRSSDGPSPSNPNLGLAANDSCLRFLMADGDNLWENYGIKLSTGGNQ